MTTSTLQVPQRGPAGCGGRKRRGGACGPRTERASEPASSDLGSRPRRPPPFLRPRARSTGASPPSGSGSPSWRGPEDAACSQRLGCRAAAPPCPRPGRVGRSGVAPSHHHLPQPLDTPRTSLCFFPGPLLPPPRRRPFIHSLPRAGRCQGGAAWMSDDRSSRCCQKTNALRPETGL